MEVADAKGQEAVIDYDLPRAENALLELERARTAPFDIALDIVRDLASTTGNKGTRSKNIENANADAWLAIQRLGEALKKKQPCDDKYWDNAVILTRHWKELLS